MKPQIKVSIVASLHKVAALRSLAKRLMHGVTVRQSFHRGVICLDAVEHSWAWTGMHRYETFDRDLQDKLLALSQDCGLLLDIGCNIGAMTLSVLMRNRNIQAVCIDPNFRALDLLKRSMRINQFERRVRIIEAAVSDEENIVCFDDTGSVTGHISGAGRNVKALKFDHLIDSHAAQQRCLVKMDIEGFETVALRRLANMKHLDNVCLVIELHPLGFNGVGDPQRCLELLRASGATVTRLEGKELKEINSGDFTQAVANWRRV